MAYSNFNGRNEEISERNYRDECADTGGGYQSVARNLKYDWTENEWVENRIHEDKGIHEGRFRDTTGPNPEHHTRRKRRRKSRYFQTENVPDIPTETVPENDDPNDGQRTQLDHRYTVGNPQVC
jgi:hypothetical protein